MKVKVGWETDNEQVELPNIVEVPENIELDYIADWLSDNYGWLVKGFTIIEEIEVDKNNVYCDICSNEIATEKVYCKICKEKHNLCSMCYEMGHNFENGIGWRV